jgi:Tol biopolymer transport system component
MREVSPKWDPGYEQEPRPLSGCRDSMGPRKEDLMCGRWEGVLMVATMLLASCSNEASEGVPKPKPAVQRDVSAPLPTGDTGAIDLASLRGRITFGVGTDIDTTEVYVVGADGSALAQLTDNDAADFDPSWSPDGSRIAFRSQRDGNDEIYVMDADGSHPRNVTRDPAADWGPEWSADGRWIAFNSGRDSNRDLHGFVVDPEGKRLRSLGDLFVEYPSWSPDGKRIAFMSQTYEAAGGNYEIFVMSADGSDVTRLTNFIGDDGWPAWSPDGTRIAFTSIRDDCRYSRARDCETIDDLGEYHTLYVMNPDGSELTRISKVFGQFPVWSPDGKYIAFTPAPDGIYVMRPDGSDLTLIPTDGLPAEPEMPDWTY